MKEKLLFEWINDDILVIRNDKDEELERIVISELNGKFKNFSIYLKYEDGKARYYMPGDLEMSVADKEEIIKSLSTYFESHDIRNYNVRDLWWEVACDNLIACICDPEWWFEPCDDDEEEDDEEDNTNQAFTKEFLKELDEHCFQNEEEVKNSQVCGCINCLKIFDAKEVGWYTSRSGIKTATCPYCREDDILGDKCGVEITPELLKCMHKM